MEMLGNHAFPRIGDQAYFLTLSPHSFFWFRLEKSDSQGVDSLNKSALSVDKPKEVPAYPLLSAQSEQ